MAAERKKTIKEIELEKSRKIMNVVAWKAGYYRANPHRFVHEVMFAGVNFRLRWFQKILLFAMVHYNYVMYLAARGRLASPHRNMWAIRAENR